MANSGSLRPRVAPANPAAAWLHAIRPKTLSAGIIPVLVGSAFAYDRGAFDLLPAAAALAGAFLIQVGTNLANDYHDHVRGADTPGRLGPPRASASGWIAPRRVLHAALLAFAAAAIVGLYLVLHAGWPILFVGLVSLASGYAYTGGPYPLGYHGWGDLFVFVFFGLVAVTGTYYVQAGPAPPDVLVAALPIGLLATAILVVNNLRDLDTDRMAGKRTLAVRLGPTATRLEYAILVLAALGAPLWLAAAWGHGRYILLPLIATPLALYLIGAVWRTRDPRRLNPLLPRTSLLLVLFGALFALGAVL